MSLCNRTPALLRAAVFIVALPIIGRAQSTSVPEKYRPFIVYNADHRSLFEKALNSLGKSGVPVGRSFALIAGVSQYPNIKPETYKTLQAAQVDLDNLQRYLRDQEFFDVVVLLKDGGMNYDNLQYFLGTYFPDLLANSRHSRFLFAYSGHGYAAGSGVTARGYLLTSAATSLDDTVNRLPMDVLRTLMGPVVDSANHVLVLVNACEAGAFRGRTAQGSPLPFDPEGKDAYAIMSSRANEQSLQLAEVGPGSVFFEKLFAALGGAADKNPADGIVTFRELADYLHAEVRYVTTAQQNTVEGDISRDGSTSEFYFLNRSRQIHIGNSPPWDPVKATEFGGEEAEALLAQGKRAFNIGSYAEAFRLLERAAEAGNSEAMDYIGYMYDKGLGVAQDYQEARQWYEKGALAGNAEAMNSLGALYYFGRGVAQNYQLARQWFEKGAAAGNAESMNALGNLYSLGLGVAQDYTQARRWYERGAGGGSASAITSVGNLYYHGWDVRQDYHQARQWYEQGAAAGSADAMSNLGIIYYLGQGVAQDDQQARQWYEKGAAAGSADAMGGLGNLYYSGRGVAQDYNFARQWYEKGAAAGSTSAMIGLAHLFYYGQGVAQDFQQARQWCEKGAGAGDARAMSFLGNLYYQGQGVTRDYNQARQWYEKGAAGGDADAMNGLGALYYLGRGLTQDYEQARRWYEKAAAAGNADAMNSLGNMYYKGLGVDQSDQEARHWFEKGAAAGSADAMTNLAGLYYYGQGVPQDFERARLWYQRAAAAGNDIAKEQLKKLPQ